jgi:hypothetical protein
VACCCNQHDISVFLLIFIYYESSKRKLNISGAVSSSD